LFYQDELNVPLVSGSIAWLVCKVIPEPHNQQTHDLFIGSLLLLHGQIQESFVMGIGILKTQPKNYVVFIILQVVLSI
jgi:flavin reductase (DIM6/NTAB) family NADH-FMN oxidoreductase RutF